MPDHPGSFSRKVSHLMVDRAARLGLISGVQIQIQVVRSLIEGSGKLHVTIVTVDFVDTWKSKRHIRSRLKPLLPQVWHNSKLPAVRALPQTTQYIVFSRCPG
jgi:hypothetical protein